MIRKIIGWVLAAISTILLLGTIGIGIYGFSSSKVELNTSVFQSGIISFFVCTGLSILLLRKQQNCCSRVSWWYKTRRALGYAFLIIFIFSLPGLHYFDVYEILPRAFILIIAYFLLKSYGHNMKKILYDLGLFLIGISIWSITWSWADWTLIGVIHRMIILIVGVILIYKFK